MRNILKIRFQIWLALVMIVLALLTLAFQGGGDEVDPAHCRPCVTRTFTPTATPTPTPIPPPLQSCRIQEIYFNERLYNPGETITATVGVTLNVTVKLVDHLGQILTGANVDATVTQTSTVQTAAVIPPLVDQSGTYDGIYLPQSQGLYLFRFSASDSTGPRFAPCSAEATVRVEPTVTPLPSCAVQLTAAPLQAQLNQPIALTASVTVNATPQSGAVVTAAVTRPDSPPDETLNFTGSGPFTARYDRTNLAGNYTFRVSVQDNPPNQRFLGCTAAPLTIPVVTTPPPPSQTINIILPSQPIDLCRHSTSNISGTIAISNAVNLTGAQLEVSYDPTFIQVIDAFGRPQPPVQVRPDPNFDPFARNQVDTRQGRIYFTANARTPVTGSSNLIYIDWRLQGRTGSTQISVTGVLTDERGARNVSLTAPLTIIVNSTCVQGTVNLQGRADHSGVTVATSAGQQTSSYSSGLFAIAAAEPLRLIYPGYLPGQIDLPAGATGSAGGEAAAVGTVTLLAGDANGDQVINILDLAYLAQHFQSADVTADLNADGIVDILDLALVAGNYRQQSSLATRK